MLRHRDVLVTLTIISFSIYNIYTETESEKTQRCNNLNNIRANYTVCCKYPTMVVWTWDYESCANTCAQQGQANERCCMQPCLYQRLGVLSSQGYAINPQGLAYSFMLSVGNDSQWQQVVTDSCDQCVGGYNPQVKPPVDCEIIPIVLYHMINCAYNEIYVNCPPWNPESLNECNYTKDYVNSCFE